MLIVWVGIYLAVASFFVICSCLSDSQTYNSILLVCLLDNCLQVHMHELLSVSLPTSVL